jgi:cobalt-zinc-cadmium efflux system membrane fusion protein
MTEDEIARLARKDLPHAQVAQVPLRAPFTGEVIERNATVGEVVDSTKILFTLADLSTVWVRADFPEHQVARLRKGLPIELRVAAYPKEVFRGTVTYVAAVVDPATRTLMVRSDVPNPDGRLRPEMFAEVSLLIEEQPVLAVTRAALQQVGGRAVVFAVVGPRRFEQREITVGQTAGDYVEVTGGLVDGDEVVTEGSYALKSELLREQMPAGGPL